MKSDSTDALERVFHEPNRLAILSAVCATPRGLAFTELKKVCRLTDGNHNRHLKVLEDAGAIRIKKAFVDDKPRTTVVMSPEGLKRFGEYLAALSEVLEKAKGALKKDPRAAAWLPSGRPATT